MNGVLSLKQFNRIRAMAIKGNESKKIQIERTLNLN